MSDSRNVLAAFSEEHTGRATGLSVSPLRYWYKAGSYPAHGADRGGRAQISRAFLIDEIVSLHVLCNQYRAPLSNLTEMSARLRCAQGVALANNLGL